MRICLLVMLWVLVIGSILYTEFSHSGRECRAKGGAPYLEGCYKTTVEKIEVTNG